VPGRDSAATGTEFFVIGSRVAHAQPVTAAEDVVDGSVQTDGRLLLTQSGLEIGAHSVTLSVSVPVA